MSKHCHQYIRLHSSGIVTKRTEWGCERQIGKLVDGQMQWFNGQLEHCLRSPRKELILKRIAEIKARGD